MTARHVLTIVPGEPGGGYDWHGHLLFDDGTSVTVFADERARVISKASAAITQFHNQQAYVPETLVLDEDGIVVATPEHFSVRA